MPWVLLAPGHGDHQPGSLAALVGSYIHSYIDAESNNLTYPMVVTKSRLLRPDERPIVVVRKHPAGVVWFIVVTTLALVAAGSLSNLFGRSKGTIFSITLFHHVEKVAGNSTVFITSIWLLYGLVSLYALWQIAAWSVSYFVITDRQMIFVAGLWVTRLASVPINKVTSWYLRESLFGNSFGYKSLVFKSGDDVRTIGRVPWWAVKGIGKALISIPREAGDEEAFKKWTAGGLRRRVRLVIAVLLICLLVVLAVAAAAVPSIQADLGKEKEIIALIPILIVLITPKN